MEKINTFINAFSYALETFTLPCASCAVLQRKETNGPTFSHTYFLGL